MSEPIGTIEFPPAWMERAWALGPEIVLTGKLEGGAHAVVAAGGVLDGGANVLGLLFPGGQRVARVSPETDWAIEEHFDGAPRPEHTQAITEIWSQLIAAMVHGVKATRAELGWKGRR